VNDGVAESARSSLPISMLDSPASARNDTSG
jgi:hypothetical protein